MDNYYDKLKALLEALEVQNIEHLLLNGDVETYQIIGEMITQKCKGFKNDQLGMFNTCRWRSISCFDIHSVHWNS